MKKFNTGELFKNGIFRKRRKAAESTDGQTIEFTPETNFYYVGISSRYRLIGIILFIALVVFVAVSLMCNAKSITYDNLFYLVKDINAAGIMAGKETSAVNYTASEKQSFAAYKKGVAVLGEHEMEIFTATGRRTLQDTVTFSNPEILASDKYVLAYDIGGNTVSLYNSFAEIFSLKYENSVYDAALSDNGSFAVVTRTKEHTSELKYYNNNFDLINDVGRSGYIIDSAINQNSDKCAFTEVTTHNGEFVTVFAVFTPGTEKLNEVTLNGVFPYRCQFISSNRVAVIGNDITYVLDTSGKIISKIYYTGKTLSYIACNDGNIVLIFENDPVTRQYLIRVFDKDGKQTGASAIDKGIIGASLCGHYLFLQYDGSITRINLSNNKKDVIEASSEAAKLIPVSDKEIMLCSPTEAVYFKFEN